MFFLSDFFRGRISFRFELFDFCFARPCQAGPIHFLEEPINPSVLSPDEEEHHNRSSALQREGSCTPMGRSRASEEFHKERLFRTALIAEKQDHPLLRKSAKRRAD